MSEFSRDAEKRREMEGRPGRMVPPVQGRPTVSVDGMEVAADLSEEREYTPGEVRSVSSTGGEKGVKLERYDLIPPEALEELARHYGRGAQKYEDDNWRRGYEWSKSYSALMRHLQAFWQGEDVDEETGSYHLTAVAWHAFTMLVFLGDQERYGGFDDRPCHRAPSEPDWRRLGGSLG